MSFEQKAYQLTILNGLIKANLDPNHELIKLAEKIDWELIAERLRPFFANRGRRSKPSRLMVGLHILKHRYNLSDEAVVERLRGDLYFRLFCGLDSAVGESAWDKLVEPSTLSKFRTRLGPRGVAIIQQGLVEQLIADKQINCRSQIVDSTVVEKDIQFPTDFRLLNAGRRRVVRHLRKLGRLGTGTRCRRTYSRLAKREMIMAGKLSKQDSPERLSKATTKLIKYARAVIHTATKAIERTRRRRKKPTVKVRQELERDVELLSRVINQTEQKLQGRHVKDKVYSFTEPHVRAIRKGKLGKRFEYGIMTTLSVDCRGFVISHQEHATNKHDTETLDDAVKGWQSATGRLPKELAADRGYSKQEYSDYIQQIDRIAIQKLGNQKGLNEDQSWFKRLRKRRASIEPIIGHLKANCRMNRARYKGFEGDQMTVSWSVIAWNCRKWARAA